jgi:hypothetical protein
MNVSRFHWKGVNPDGTFADGSPGMVNVNPGISCPTLHAIIVNGGRTPGGEVLGFTFEFDTLQERRLWLHKSGLCPEDEQ